MSNKAVVNLNTGLGDPETVAIALLVAVAAAGGGRRSLMFRTRGAVRVALAGGAAGSDCDGFPSIEGLLDRYVAASGKVLVCPACFAARQLDEGALIGGATIGGTVPMWEWIGDEGATTFSY